MLFRSELSLQGWLRQGEQLVAIEQMSGWVSPRLQIRFAWQEGQELTLYRPDGQRFLSFVELEAQLLRERQLVQQERQRTQQERQRAQQERQRAEEATAALQEERRQRQALLERLREMGINPEQL